MSPRCLACGIAWGSPTLGCALCLDRIFAARVIGAPSPASPAVEGIARKVRPLLAALRSRGAT